MDYRLSQSFLDSRNVHHAQTWSPPIDRRWTASRHRTRAGDRLRHPADIHEIVSEAETAGAPRLGLCLDTCHLLAAGYDLGTDASYAETIAQLDELLGLDRLRAVHLNDSKTPLGSHIDRHTHIGSGHVGLSVFRRLLTDARLDHVPMVLETPKGRSEKSAVIEADPMDLENLRTLRAMMEAPD